MLQQSLRICCHFVSFTVLPVLLSSLQYLYRIQIEHGLLPVCIFPSWMSTSCMQDSSAGAACMPLCLWGWHVAVGVVWLRHCHALDVMRKSTLDLPLWSAFAAGLCVSGMSSQQTTEGAWYQREAARRPERLMLSQTGARLTDLGNKILTSLSETITSQASVGKGRGRGRMGGGREEKQGWWHQSLSLCGGVFGGGWEKSSISTSHSGTVLTPLPKRLRTSWGLA